MTQATPFLIYSAAEAGDLAERVRRSVVSVRSRAGGGAATAWDCGLLITNHHVVPSEHAEIVTSDGRTFPATVIGRDPERDLAALRADGADLVPLEAGDSSGLRPGQLVFAVGNPWGRPGFVTAGVVFGTSAAGLDYPSPSADVVRADVRLAPGNSGGPLCDAEGRVVGINSMIVGGMAVAIASNAVANFVATLGGEPGALGIALRPVPAPALAAVDPSQAADTALLVIDVAEGSPGERSGLLPGDIVLALDGERGVEPIARRLRGLRRGRAVRFELLRGKEVTSVEAVPGEAAL
jgi:serine protease Do